MPTVSADPTCDWERCVSMMRVAADTEVHKVLTEKVFLRQGHVWTADQITGIDE